jgi:hypothetical protein
VHHVDFDSKHSPHVIDLKKQTFNVWESVNPVAPETKKNKLYSYDLGPQPAEPSIFAASSEQKTEAAHETTDEQFTPAETIAPPSKKVLSQRTITIALPSFNIAPFLAEARERLSSQAARAHATGKKTLASWRTNLTKEQLKPAFSKLTTATKKSLTEKITTSSATVKKSPQKLFAWWHNLDASPWQKRLAGALAALLIISIIPSQAQTYYQSINATKASLTEKSTNGFLALQESTGALLNANVPDAEAATVQALENLSGAVTILDTRHQLLQKMIAAVPFVGEEVQSRSELIRAGQKISLGNVYLIKGVDESLHASGTPLLGKLDIIIKHVRAALPNYQEAQNSLNRVNPAKLPLEYQASFVDFKKIFTSATQDFTQLADLGDTLHEIFGGHGLRRYLLVFQNPAEIRATGGFIGSFAEIDVKDGKITRFEVPPGGSYDVQGQLRDFIEPPAPLLMANKRWEFQDANWFPDFPASADKLLWFYRHSERGSVDGIVAINASVLERLLSIVGPLTDQKRGVTFSSSTALTSLQTIVEEGSEKKKGKPKQVIGDLSHTFLGYFNSISPKDLLPVLVNLKESLDQKEIQVYFADQDAENKLARFGWSGSILPTKPLQDYLMVVNSNILGEKSDARIKQTVTHQAVVANDGSITDTVTITREHTGNPGEKFYGKPNIDFVRIYTPKGSKLLSAQGFSWPDEKNFRAPDSWSKPDPTLTSIEKVVTIDDQTGTRVTEEFDKYAFGNWIVTEPGKISQVQITYQLPFNLGTLVPPTPPSLLSLQNLLGKQTPVSTYQLVAQRQSGVESSLQSTIIFPASWVPVWKDGQGLEVAKNGATLYLPILEKDGVWSLAMKKI